MNLGQAGARTSDLAITGPAPCPAPLPTELNPLTMKSVITQCLNNCFAGVVFQPLLLGTGKHFTHRFINISGTILKSLVSQKNTHASHGIASEKNGEFINLLSTTLSTVNIENQIVTNLQIFDCRN